MIKHEKEREKTYEGPNDSIIWVLRCTRGGLFVTMDGGASVVVMVVVGAWEEVVTEWRW
jgi:hypothetical protein